MEKNRYHYDFLEHVPFRAVQDSLLLAVLAAEGLHGESRVRLDASYCLDKRQRTCVVNATTTVGRDINRILTGFLIRQFGRHAFRVERLNACPRAKTT